MHDDPENTFELYVKEVNFIIDPHKGLKMMTATEYEENT